MIIKQSSHRRGAAGQQYAIIVGLIAVVALAAVAGMGGGINALMTKTSNVMRDASNGVVTQGAPSGGGGPSPACATVAASCKALQLAGCTADGTYTIDIDGPGTRAPMSASCDMTTDGGGWTLVLNYLHAAATTPSPSARATLPVQGSSEIGTNESASSANWGHANNALMTALAFTELRHYCISGFHNRVMHFKTGESELIGYYRNGGTGGAMSGHPTPYAHTKLPGHTANLPETMNYVYVGAGELAMTNHPFFRSGVGSWAIAGNLSANRWECDDYANGAAYSTIHRIWVR